VVPTTGPRSAAVAAPHWMGKAPKPPACEVSRMWRGAEVSVGMVFLEAEKPTLAKTVPEGRGLLRGHTVAGSVGWVARQRTPALPVDRARQPLGGPPRCSAMRRYIRAATPGATYFFTLTLQDRRGRWLVDHVDALRQSVARARQLHPFHIDAMVILPEHLHALWTLPPEDANYPMRWMLVKRSFTRALLSKGVLDSAAAARRGAAERSLWQRRYWEHQIRDEDDFSRHVDYIHFNPVKHGWVLRAADWPYSSIHRYVRQGLLPRDWGVGHASEGQFGE